MISATDYDHLANELRKFGTTQAAGGLDTKELVRFATLAASSHNTQPWKFRVGTDSITILPDYTRRCPVVDPDDSHLFKSLGCAAENLVHAATAQGFASHVKFDPSEDSVIVRFECAASAHATELFQAIPKRQCTRSEYDGQPLDPAELEMLKQAGQGENVRTILLLSEAEKEAVIEYVTQGNHAQLTDQAFRNELVTWIRFNPGTAVQTGDGLAGRANGQPALPTWLAKSITGLVVTAKGQAETDAKNIRSSAGIAVFVASRDDKAAWVETGRVYERFALQATALDIRNAFINQPIEVPSLRPQFESWLKLNGEHALLLVRFGRGHAMPFSLRRPLDEVIVQDRPKTKVATTGQ